MSTEPGASDDREDRINAAIAEYLDDLEPGRKVDRKQFLARYPDLAEELAKYLDHREQLHRLIDPLIATGSAANSCPRCHWPLETSADSTTCVTCGWRAGARPPADPLPVPYCLGRFKLLEVIGRGGFGVVYRGWHAGLHRHVAVKVLRASGLTTAEDHERFLRDPKIAAQLNHPGIVKVHDVGVAEGTPYLVSEFIPGRTLAALIREGRPAPERSAWLVAAVADALQHAHDANVIHRDVKPANIIVTDNGAPMLTDFGLARWDVADANVNDTLTEDGLILGTLAYMSPEQARGHAHRVDGRSDVYSLGVVLYESLTGERPFTGSRRGVLHQIEFDEPRPPRALDDRIPVDLQTVCLKCLRKEPGGRYASAAEVAADLRRYLARRPILARPIGRVESLVLWGRRNPPLALAVGAVLALLVTVTSVSVGWAVHANRQADAIRTSLHALSMLATEVELDRGVADADRGEIDAGLLRMARSLETVPGDENELEWTIRANLRAWDRHSVGLEAVRPIPPGELLGVRPDGLAGWVLEPDGRAARRWNLDPQRPAELVLKHPERVTMLALTPDATRVATVCSDLKKGGVVRIWDAATGRLMHTHAPGGTIGAVAFSGDGQLLIVAAHERAPPGPAGQSVTRFQVWETATGKGLDPAFRQPNWVTAMALAPDGRTLYTLTRSGTKVQRVTVGSNSPDTVLSSPVALTALAVSPDGRYLLTGGSDRFARLHELGTNRSLVLGRHRAAVSTAIFDPNGRRVTTVASGDAVRTWEGFERLNPQTVRHPATVRAIAVSSDGRRVATGADDFEVRVWEVRDGRLSALGALQKHQSPLAAIAYSPNGDRLATGVHQHHEAVLWDATALVRGPVLRHPAPVRHIAFSPDGTRVATIGFDSTVRVWTTDTGNLLAGPIGTGEVSFAVAFSPDGRSLLTGSMDGAVRRWSADTGERQGEPLWHAPGQPVYAAAISPDGKFILSGGGDHTAQLWDADGVPCAPQLRHTAPVRSVAFGPTGRWVVTVSDDGIPRCWNTPTGRTIGPSLRHHMASRCVAVDPLGRWLLTGGGDGTVRVWPAPEPLVGPPHQLVLWAQVRTGAELVEAGGVRVLDPDTWRTRRDRLKELDPVSP